MKGWRDKSFRIKEGQKDGKKWDINKGQRDSKDRFSQLKRDRRIEGINV